ncbi:MAG: hypothetical protein H8D95_01045 [Candidatus Endolissoclinum sp.]|nr:hypothetical protein [Candidatus Endolissoclinum sp.]
MATMFQKYHEESVFAAQKAAKAEDDKWGDRFGMCGFAWVTAHPVNKGNTRLGKEERKILESIGFEKDWTGKTYQIWNPSGHPTQNIDVKEAGAEAYVSKMNELGSGIKLTRGSRLD